MIFIESIVAAVLLFLALSRNLISDYRLIILVMSCLFVASFIPSLTVPYILDDVDQFHNLAVAIDSHQVFGWLMTPHNEHTIPFLKMLYLFCYKYFWLDPEVFHVAVTVVCLGIVVLVYRLILVLTGSFLPAFIGASIIAATNLTDEAAFIITNSSIFFCIFLLLLLFYAIYRYAETRKPYWRYVAFFSILLAPATFASGLTSIIFVFLFYRLCLSEDLQQKGGNLFPLLVMGWLLSMAPYLYSMNDIIYANHYLDVGETSVFGVARFSIPIQFLGGYVAMKLIPDLTANLYLSFGIFFLCFFTIIKYFKEIAWKRILFFVTFGLFNNFIIYIFRSKWGILGLETSRYDAFPVIMMAFSYALVLDVFVKQIPHIKKISVLMLVYVVCFFAVLNGSLYRYIKGDLVFRNTVAMQMFYFNFRKVFMDYDQEYHPAHLQYKSGSIIIPSELSRYALRSREFYAEYVLPSSIKNKIVWSNKTDPEFLEYLKAKGYPILTKGE